MDTKRRKNGGATAGTAAEVATQRTESNPRTSDAKLEEEERWPVLERSKEK